MPLWSLLVALLAAYAAISLGALPMVKERWKAASNFAKVSKVGIVAAMTTLDAFLKVALIVFTAAFAVFAILWVLAPSLEGNALIALHKFTAIVRDATKPLRDAAGRIALWVALAGLAYFAYRARSGRLQKELEQERQRQFDLLVDRWNANELEELPPTAEMTQAQEQLSACSSAIEKILELPEEVRSEQLPALIKLHDTLARQVIFLDLDRRIDLTNVPILGDQESGRWSKFRIGLFGERTQKVISFVSRYTARAGTALACLLTIGVAAPAIASKGLVPTLERLSDVLVFQTEKRAAQSLAAISRVPPAPPEEVAGPDGQEEDEDDGAGNQGGSNAYRIVARQFIQALAQSEGWRTASAQSLAEQAVVPVKPARSLEEIATSETILREYAASSPAQSAKVRLASVAEGAELPAAGRQRWESYRSAIARGAPLESAQALNKTEEWLRLVARQSPHVEGEIALAARAGPVSRSVGDVAEAAFMESISFALERALPTPAGAGTGEIPLWRAGRNALQDGSARFLRLKFAEFLHELATGGSLKASLAAVRAGTGDAFILRAPEAAEVRDVLSQSRILAEVAPDNVPTLHAAAKPGERQLAKRLVEAVRSQETIPDRSAARHLLEGSVGNYDDLFPGQTAAPERTALGDALSVLAEAAAESITRPRAPNTSRSFRLLRGSFRVGGVLIGNQPESSEPQDYRGLSWSRSGDSLRLWLIDNQGRRLELGTFRGSLIQQALAYAADGRPVAVTMTSGPMQMLRIHPHPAVVDTALGCDLIELDRFVDRFSAVPAQNELMSLVARQLDLYNLSVDREYRSRPWEYPFSPFLPGWRLDDPQWSVFAHYPNRFDFERVRKVQQCADRFPNDTEGYLGCMARFRTTAGRHGLQEFTIWSGVREGNFSLDPHSLAGNSARGDALRFMLQVAFAHMDGRDPETGPWEFPMIQSELDGQVRSAARADPETAGILDRATQFTLLQRVFRAGLAGHLGPAFPRASLVGLMRAARQVDVVTTVPTPDWNGRRQQFDEFLQQAGLPEPFGFDTERDAGSARPNWDDRNFRFVDDGTCPATLPS